MWGTSRFHLGSIAVLTVYTNDLPEAVHGGLCLYADDSTFTLINKNTDELNVEIDQKYKIIAQYMNKNKLILNSDKTHLMVMTSARKHATHENFGIYLDTGTEIILPQSEERLLGANLSNSLSWNSHIRDTKNSLISILTPRINALANICCFSSFLTRKMVATRQKERFISREFLS